MSARLTDAQQRDREVTEADLQRLITDVAAVYGWSWVHFRAGQTQRGWRVPVEGPLGKGWPDLVLVHPTRRRLIFAELKRETGQVDADQAAVLAVLEELTDRAIAGNATKRSIEVHVWRPSDLTEGRIQAVLGG